MTRRPNKTGSEDPVLNDSPDNPEASAQSEEDKSVTNIPFKSPKTGRTYVIKRTKELDQYEEDTPATGDEDN